MNPSPMRWEVAAPAPSSYLSQLSHVHPLMAQVLYNRGVPDAAAADAFLDGVDEAPNPFALPGVHRAVSRIRQALRRGELIAVYGDFDADGVTATALMVQTLEALGGHVKPYIPDRASEGYGLNKQALGALARDGVSLVITVDCGIRGHDEIAVADQLGLDVVVTDHHALGAELPAAAAVIDPHLAPRSADALPGGALPGGAFDGLAGVGVAYRLAQALLRVERQAPVADLAVSLAEEDLLDLVALGTVADVVPLRGQNRSLVRRGLEHLNAMERPGIRALSQQAGLKPGTVDATAIGYVLGPRINAAGRLADAQKAYRLLVTADPAEAQALASALDGLNRERQRMTHEAHQIARGQVLRAGGDGLLLFAADRAFRPGIVGLVASRLLDEFYRPAVVVEMGERVSRGSCRSIAGFHITRALEACDDLLLRFGGHAAAAGFQVRNDHLKPLAHRLQTIAADWLREEDLTPVLAVDAEVPLPQMSWELLDALSQLEPCGCGNPQPVFMSRGVDVRSHRAVGREGKHLKLALSDGVATWDAIGFRLGAWADRLPPRVDLAYRLELNEWRGRRSLQLNVQDIRPAKLT